MYRPKRRTNSFTVTDRLRDSKKSAIHIFLIVQLGTVHKWCHPLKREKGSAKTLRYSIIQFSKMGDKGFQKSQKMGDVIYSFSSN